MSETKETKKCKYCQSDIPKKAKICPNCRKKQGGILKWVGIVLVIFIVIGIGTGSSEEDEPVKNTGKIENTVPTSSEQKNNTSTTNKTNAEPTPEAQEDNIFEVGEFAETEYLKISYLSCSEYKSDNRYIQPKDGYVFYRLEFEFENLDKNDTSVSYYDFQAYADGYALEKRYFDDDLSATLSSGKKTKGAVYFEVPVDAKEVIAEYEISVWNSDKIIFTIK